MACKPRATQISIWGGNRKGLFPEWKFDTVKGFDELISMYMRSFPKSEYVCMHIANPKRPKAVDKVQKEPEKPVSKRKRRKST